ncbi:MAG: fluoride efflux transporter CrcB [Salinivirgaceae bacterium]|nr:fluoride efflux transporter CrcB [Salinivirgaceae bacterium]
MRQILFIGLGGFIGTIARYLLSKLINNAVTVSFPYGTLVVNILGSVLIGALYGYFESKNLISNELKLFFTVGICGGFTTFSAFAHENFLFLRDGNIYHFAIYTSVSVILGIAAILLGYWMIKL